MYTQCPDCQTAFQVTAKVLQQAGGKVRCGGCGNAFNALDFLSEQQPAHPDDSANSATESAVDDAMDDETFAEQTSALLETLDELAGPEDIRIEDTGVEWRVLDEVAQASKNQADIDDTSSIPVYSEDALGDVAGDSSDPQIQDALDLESGDESAVDPGEMRFDDNTPLPDDFDEVPDPSPTPQRRAEDLVEEQAAVVHDLQEDLELGEADDWEQLLNEVEVRSPDQNDQVSMEVEEELAAIHSELAGPAASTPETEPPVDDSPTADIPLYSEADADVEQVAGELLESEDEDTAEEDEDSATVIESDEEEPDGRQSLKESTGSFEKQIAAAKDELDRQLDGNDAEEAGEIVEPEDEVDEEKLDEEDTDVEALAYEDFTDDDVIEIVSHDDSSEDDESISLADDDEAGIVESEDDPREEDADQLLEAEIDQQAAGPDESDEVAESTDEPDDDPMEATIGGVPASLLAEAEDNAETIIMEGEFIRGSIEKERRAADHAAVSKLDDPKSLVDTYAIQRGLVRGGRRRGDPISPGIIAGTVIFVLVLVAQIVHTNREALSTYGAFSQTLGPVYRIIGSPVTPQWDVKGWRFEATNGATDEGEEMLTIFSRIINRSERPLPYPLVHVSLTDRWEEIIGSKVLEPGEYLAGDLDPSKPVSAGENFTAVISVAAPDPDATGFKLNVCYRVSPGRVRCATEDFKE